MRTPLLTTCTVATLLTATAVAQGSDNSGVGSDAEFVSRLDISPESQDDVYVILNATAGDYGDAVNRARLACRISKAVFGDDKVYTPTSSDYEDLAEDNWSMTCWLDPQCILQPDSTADVSRAVLIASYLGSQFSVRSGGHNPNIGFSSVGSDGLLIDMARLDGVEISSSDGSVASIGPGNRWGRVYEVLSASGRMAVGGRANAIGVGGLLLGGGLSYWSSIHGMAFNKVVNYEVVLGNSSIVNANQTSNQDLWWALRGGGANFGIVTRFDVETVENCQIWFEGLFFDVVDQESVLRAAAEYAAAAEDDADASATFNLGPTGGAAYFAYNKPVERPDIFSAFYDIPHQAVINSTLGTWVDFHNAVSALNPFGDLRIAISVYDRQWDTETLLDHYKRYLAVATDVQERLNATMYLAPQIYSKSAVAEDSAKGGSPIGLSPVTHCFLEVMINWTDAEFDDEATKVLTDLGDDLTASARELGTDLDFHYMNDAGANQGVLESYESVERMRSVSEAYDPYRVFQGLQYGGFLLDRN